MMQILSLSFIFLHFLETFCATIREFPADQDQVIPSIKHGTPTSFINTLDKALSFNNASGTSLSFLLRRISKASKSVQCGNDVIQMFLNVQREKMWAYSMFDAFGKPGSGIARGNLIWAGSYSECETIGKYLNSTEFSFQGQYCWAEFDLTPLAKKIFHVPPFLPEIPFKTALCLPDSCSDETIKEFIGIIFEHFPSLPEYLNFTGVDCMPRNRDIWKDKGAIISLKVTYTLIHDDTLDEEKDDELLEMPDPDETKPQMNYDSLLLTDDVDVTHNTQTQQEVNKVNEILLLFSVRENGAKIVHLSSHGKHALGCLNGIRFLSMIWIILIQSCLIGINVVDNQKDLLDVINTLPFQIIYQRTFAFDSLFVISGVSLAYLFCKSYDNVGAKISWWKFFLRRYFRMTPAYLFVLVLLEVSLSKYFNYGPFWPTNGFEGDKCSKNWWWNILYINNFISVDKMCMSYTWYLANEMQLYILSPLLLIPFLIRSLPLISLITGILILVSSVTSGVLSMHYNITAGVDVKQLTPGSDKYTTLFDFTDKPYFWVGSLAVGLVCGWLLHTTKCKVTMKKHWILLGWAASLICYMSVMLSLFKSHPTQAISSLYFAISRIGWSFGLLWLIFVCCTGNGGLVNEVLSWVGWKPFSRLTYSAYLVHVLVIKTLIFSTEVPLHFTYSFFILLHVVSVFFTYLLGFAVSLTVELPFSALEKLIFS